MRCQRHPPCYKLLPSFLLLYLAAIVVSGCAYNGALRKDFHHPSGSYGQKLPLKVAILADPPIKTKQVRLSPELLGGGIQIEVHPGLVNAAAVELASVFDEVRVIDHPGQATDDDLLAVIRLSVVTQSEDRLFGEAVYVSRLGIAFLDQSGRQVAVLEDSRRFQYKTPTSSRVASFLTGFTLFLLSPVTIPWMNYAEGSHARELLEDSIDHSLQSISYGITLDSRLKAFADATRRVPQPPVALAPREPTTSPSVIPRDRAGPGPQTRKQTPLITTGTHVARDPKTPRTKHRFVVWSEYPGVVSAITELIQKTGDIVVERAHLQEVFDEQKIRLTHTPDDEANLLHVGKLIGADRVVFAEVSIRPEVIGQSGPSGSGGASRTVYHTSIAVRGVSVESGEVQWSGTAQPRMPISDPEVAVVILVQWAMGRAICPVEAGYEWKDPEATATTKDGCRKKE